jgi:hypothetical protein
MHGGVWQGMVTADDLSTEGFGPLCWVLWNPDKAVCGSVERGVAGQGHVRQCRARAVDGSTGGFGSHCCSLWGVDVARLALDGYV